MSWTPQRLYARYRRKAVKIQSGLHGDMQRLAEMTSPSSKMGSNNASVSISCGRRRFEGTFAQYERTCENEPPVSQLCRQV